jgi:hypothetical protein
MPRIVRYTVRLNASERPGPIDLVTTGQRAAATITRARILLKADVGPAGEAWDDDQIADAFETSLSTVHRVRQAFVEEGLEELDGDQEAHLIAVACRAAPGGRARWTLRLVADELVELQVGGPHQPGVRAHHAEKNDLKP